MVGVSESASKYTSFIQLLAYMHFSLVTPVVIFAEINAYEKVFEQIYLIVKVNIFLLTVAERPTIGQLIGSMVFSQTSGRMMTNLHSHRQLVFADEQNEKESISVTIFEVCQSK